ncbi:NUDIX domain-containing protein [Alkalihalobacillus sp. TS-13]|uniref:NUDIX hydrolase n=1 Tax=Alkalihalobacillus sp. TS-13 TaxID=2842455 RepID=UPI001C889AED|nr:NUDIX domain-containing protein [Alkalihalobacillus sp. TS-13]
MESELLKIYDDQRNPLGVATREEVHRMGFWHETFHCWVTSLIGNQYYIYLQIRSNQKKDYPNLLDITAAGHILAKETIDDGIREIEEEIGIDVTLEELKTVGKIESCTTMEGMIDKEIAHVFLYDKPMNFDDFTLQEDEVSGIVKAEFNAFHEFCSGKAQSLLVEGFNLDPSGMKIPVKMTVDMTHFVPNDGTYYEQVANKIRKLLYKLAENQAET